MRLRKNLRLAEFDYSQSGAYFITACTADRKNLLGSIVGGDAHIAPTVRLSPAGEVVRKHLRTIPGVGDYVIMPNHVHLILHISADDMLEGPMWASAPTRKRISNLVRSWKILVTKELGYSIWQRSYYDHIIRSEKDYIQIMRYIEENPAKWHENKYYDPM